MVRSTSVPTALRLFSPRIRSPSQCPGTARSATSAGRSLIITIPGSRPRLSVAVRALRAVRPDLRQRVSSRRNCPRPCTNKDW